MSKTRQDQSSLKKPVSATLVEDEHALTDGDENEAPRPVSGPEIVAMMAGRADKSVELDADMSEESQAAMNELAGNESSDEIGEQSKQDKVAGLQRWNFIISLGIGAGLFLGVGALLILIFISARDTAAGILVLGCFVLLASIVVVVVAIRSMPRIMPSQFNADRNMDNHGGDSDGPAGFTLAGTQALAALNLAEKVLDDDPNPRLVARRDGVVVFANKHYQKLAKDAGVEGYSGLPPRIERLFGQQGAEAMKIFRLCRAARSGKIANEEIYQVSGHIGGGARRRFDVSVRPIEADDQHVTWSLHELTVDEEEHDPLASAYAEYQRPIFALEKSGQIAWANAAMREKLGAEKGALHHINDVVLGETGELTLSLWDIGTANPSAKIRRENGGPLDGTFSSFCRGGSGEGFVCVELMLEDELAEQDELTLSGDITEAPFGVAIIEGEFGKDAKIVEANKAFTEVFGGAVKNTVFAKRFSTETIEELAREVKRKSNTGGASQIIETRTGEGPAARVFALYVKPVSRRRGGYGTRRSLIFSLEITERRRMELDYGQDQKLKAIGNLAGEVAHDFNNFLQTIMGNCDLLLMNHPVGDPSYDELVVIRENSQRLANLTKQLLAFSRKQTMKRATLSVTELLRDFTKFLDRAVGDKVKLELINGRGLRPVRVDQNQLEAAIMNLAVNARDAMGSNGGRLILRTRHVEAQEIIDGGLTELSHQDHVLLEIADTGPGVPPDIADKIFDPFFTTKDVGQGTGLGLSTVHGVIGQMGGGIYLSEGSEGLGAVFRIYLPAMSEEEMVKAQNEAPAKPVEVSDLTGVGRILVVEDEDSVRNFVVIALKGRGYEVLEACDGVDALEMLEEFGADHFDLIISDVMMAEMDGPVFVREAQENHDYKRRVIFMSGYAETAMREQIDLIENTGYLQKPFQAEVLASAVKEMIGGPAG